MIIGVGIDMVKIEKLRQAIERWGDSFINRVYNSEELVHIANGKMYYQRLAARFAAKEAVFKAISQYKPVALKDIFVLNKADGAPYCKFVKDIGVEVFLSISHLEDYAVACAFAQKK